MRIYSAIGTMSYVCAFKGISLIAINPDWLYEYLLQQENVCALLFEFPRGVVLCFVEIPFSCHLMVRFDKTDRKCH